MSNPDEDAQAGYETSDASAIPIWITGAGLLVCLALTIGLVTLFLNALHRRDLLAQKRTEVDRVTSAVAASRPHYPEPRLQVAPEADLATLRAAEDAKLITYGWIDHQAGVVRIPIERAMDLLVQRGLPVRGDPQAPKPSHTPLDMQQARPLERPPLTEEK